MIVKMCAKCKKIIEYPNTYCPICQEKVNKLKEERQKLYEKDMIKREILN